MNCYSIVKQSATHADALAAIGAADMFRHVEPHIVERENRFEIQFPRDLEPSDVDAVDPGFSYLAAAVWTRDIQKALERRSDHWKANLAIDQGLT